MGNFLTDGFVFFSSYYEAVRPIPDQERLTVLDAILDYVFLGQEPDLPPILIGYFALIRPVLDKSIKRRTASVANGKRGGRPPKDTHKEAGENLPATNEKPTINQAETFKGRDKDGDKEMDKEGNVLADKPPRAPRFTPPSVEEVAEYCRERENRVDPQRFVDFYASKGWLVGRAKMKDWKAAVRTWEGRGQKGDRDITNPDRYDYKEGESL